MIGKRKKISVFTTHEQLEALLLIRDVLARREVVDPKPEKPGPFALTPCACSVPGCPATATLRSDAAGLLVAPPAGWFVSVGAAEDIEVEGEVGLGCFLFCSEACAERALGHASKDGG